MDRSRGRSLPSLILALSLLGTGCSQPADESTDQAADATTPAVAVQIDDLVLYTPSNKTETYLVDGANNPVFQWPSQYEAGQSAFLQSDGSILRAASINALAPDNRFVAGYAKGHNDIFQIGGIVERISKEGNVVWSFEYYDDTHAPHHVATVMPNGNLLMPVWRYFSEDQSLALGRDPHHLTSGGLWIDSLIEVKPGASGGEIVWEWHASDHLVQDFDEGKANYGQLTEHPRRIDVNYGKGFNIPEDFMHVNSAYYVEELDQILLTVYHYSELWVIDHSTTTAEAAGSTGGKYGHGGELLYRWGNPWVYGHQGTSAFLLSAVHDPKWLPQERHFIMYDNNVPDLSRSIDGGNSMLVEIAPPIAADGSYALDESGVFGPEQPLLAADLGVAASSVGTAQRMADGRFLSCDCPKSQAIWLDASGAVIATANLWENTTQDSENTQVYRLVAYSKDDPGAQALGK